MKTASALLVLLGALTLTQGARAEKSPVWDAGERVLLAQMSPEERRAMRERWERMPRDERDALRDQFQERLQRIPPEERELRRRELMERWRNLPPQERESRRHDRREDRGYGQGYEYRELEEQRPDWGGVFNPRGRDR